MVPLQIAVETCGRTRNVVLVSEYVCGNLLQKGSVRRTLLFEIVYISSYDFPNPVTSLYKRVSPMDIAVKEPTLETPPARTTTADLARGKVR